MLTEIVILIVVFIVIVVMGFSVFFGAPYVPTRRKWASDALKLAGIKTSDVVVDLGSGDGMIIKLVAGYGAKAIGYEINPILYLLSRIRTVKYGKQVRVKLKNYWQENLPTETTIVYVFGLERDSERLERYLKNQAKLVRVKKLKIVTFGFSLPNQKPIKSGSGAKLYIL